MSLVAYTYSPLAFDRRYYEQVLTGGNPRGFEFDEPQQQSQLANKWEEAKLLGFTPVNAYFVGCARGFEVRFWEERGIDSFGMDVSQWAIENGDETIRNRLHLYPGGRFYWASHNCSVPDDAFEAVLAFDVLTLIPSLKRTEIIDEMVRIASKGILVRTLLQHDPTNTQEIHGVDGVPYHLEGLDYWRFAFCRSDKFKLHGLVPYDHPGYLQAVMAFIRR